MQEPVYIVEERKELMKGLQTLNEAREMMKKDAEYFISFITIVFL